MRAIKYIHIWSEQKLSPEFSQAVFSFLSHSPVEVKFHRSALFRKILPNPRLLGQIAGFRLINHQQKEPLVAYPVEVVQEKKFLIEEKNSPFVYEAGWLANFYRRLVKSGLTAPAVVITNRLLATFGEDGRYHLRYAYFSYPTVISLPGIEQAPARDKRYYQLKLFDPLLAKKIAGANLTGQELSLALVNILDQALFYFTTFEPFCPNKNCRLYNFHWHKELRNILRKNQFCERHQKMLAELF